MADTLNNEQKNEQGWRHFILHTEDGIDDCVDDCQGCVTVKLIEAELAAKDQQSTALKLQNVGLVGALRSLRTAADRWSGACSGFKCVFSKEQVCRDWGGLCPDHKKIIDDAIASSDPKQEEAIRGVVEALVQSKPFVQQEWDITKGTEREGSAMYASHILNKINEALSNLYTIFPHLRGVK